MDVVFLNLNVPKIDCHEMLSSLREQHICENIPVVVMTGSTSPLDEERARDNGVLCYLVKPMTVEEIERTKAKVKDVLPGLPSCRC